VARAAVPALARRALADHDAAAADLAVRLLQPGRMFVALLAAVLAIVAAVEPSRWLLPWTVWAVAAGASFLWPLPFLRRDRVPARYLVRYPLVTLLAALWIPVRVVARVRGGGPWERTPHGATSP
jgi:hypothetical protein